MLDNNLGERRNLCVPFISIFFDVKSLISIYGKTELPLKEYITNHFTYDGESNLKRLPKDIKLVLFMPPCIFLHVTI